MFGIGMPELLLILAVALIVIGPKKLPDLAKSLGRAMGEFKRATNDLKQSIEQETGLDEVRQSMKDVKQDLRRSFDDIDTRPLDASGAAPAGTKESTPEEIALAKLEKEPDDPGGEAGSKTVDNSTAKSGGGDAR
jgi:Tat protein translocase TatB subunit